MFAFLLGFFFFNRREWISNQNSQKYATSLLDNVLEN